MSRVGRARDKALKRLAPTKPPEDIASVVLEARQRHYDLTPEQSHSDHAGTVLGRLWLRGLISEEEREAGYRYEAILRDYSRSRLSPSLPAAGHVMQVPSDPSDEDRRPQPSIDPEGDYKTWAINARTAWERCDRVLGSSGSLVRAAVELTIRGDMEAVEFGLALHAGLTALAVAFGLAGRERAA